MPSEKINSNKIKKLLKKINHPFINSTLWELGILKSVRVQGKKVVVELNFPFPNIPIKDQLINLVKKPLLKLSLSVIVKTKVMDEVQRQHFLKIEQENWKN